jgi:hypothetical protein
MVLLFHRVLVLLVFHQVLD